jgi:transcriptional regulator with XRE-family HTH domain
VSESINTQQGLAELAILVRRARGSKGLREFAREANLDPMTIRRLEEQHTQNPSDTTFAALAHVVGVTFEELKAIASQSEQSANQTKARNQLNLLTDADAIELIVERLKRMDSANLAIILRAIADCLSTNP